MFSLLEDRQVLFHFVLVLFKQRIGANENQRSSKLAIRTAAAI